MNTLKHKGFLGYVAFSEADKVFIRTAVERQIAAML